jgi:hypothetical protein
VDNTITDHCAYRKPRKRGNVNHTGAEWVGCQMQERE